MVSSAVSSARSLALRAQGLQVGGPQADHPSRELAEQHYGVHKERPFFAGLVDFITSGPVVAMVWEGDGVIASARKLIGATKPLEAEPGTSAAIWPSTSAAM